MMINKIIVYYSWLLCSKLENVTFTLSDIAWSSRTGQREHGTDAQQCMAADNNIQ